MKALVVAEDQRFVSWLEEALDAGSRVDHVASFDLRDVGRSAVNGNVDLILVEFAHHRLMERVALVEGLQDQVGAPPVVGIAAEENAEWVLAAVRAGARDFFVYGRDDANLSTQLGRLMKRSSAAQSGRSPAAAPAGRLFTVLGGQPHDGIAFLAEHLALALTDSVEPGGRTLLVDLATPAGAAAIFLNVNPSYSALDAIRDVGRCDQTLIDTAFTKHESGLYVLSLPEDLLGRPSFDIDETMRLLDVLKSLFTYTVVAVDGHMQVDGLASLITRSDRTLLLSDQSILKSRHAKYLLRALRLEDCPLDRMGLVVDNYRRRMGLEPGNLAELFELPLLATLASEGFHRVVSMNSGEPMFTLAKKDPYCKGVRGLTDMLIKGQTTMVKSSGGLLDRILGGS